MITELRIEGFKAFQDPQRIPIRPITLIFGQNGSGKSSILHAIALLHELGRGSTWEVHRTELTGGLLDLGGMSTYTHYVLGESVVRLGITVPAAAFPRLPAGAWVPTDDVSVDVEHYVGPCGDCRDRRRISMSGETIASFAARVPGRVLWEDGRLADVLGPEFDGLTEVKSLYRDLLAAHPERRTELAGGLLALLRCLEGVQNGLIPSAVIPAPADDLLVTIRSAFEGLGHAMTPGSAEQWLAGAAARLNPPLGTIAAVVARCIRHWDYLGPYRPLPSRYLLRYSSEARRIGLWGDFGNVELLEQANNWLAREDRLNAGYRLVLTQYADVEALKDGNDEVQHILDEEGFCGAVEHLLDQPDIAPPTLSLYEVENLVTGARTQIPDVGFGVSQVLPIVAKAVARSRHLVAVEQPELHVHPAMQAAMGDLFIESACGERKNTFLIETHSEHLILRVLRRIRECALGRQPDWVPRIGPNDVAVLYVVREAEGARIVELRVSEDGGFIDPWPHGFFPERLHELF